MRMMLNLAKGVVNGDDNGLEGDVDIGQEGDVDNGIGTFSISHHCLQV